MGRRVVNREKGKTLPCRDHTAMIGSKETMKEAALIGEDQLHNWKQKSHCKRGGSDPIKSKKGGGEKERRTMGTGDFYEGLRLVALFNKGRKVINKTPTQRNRESIHVKATVEENRSSVFGVHESVKTSGSREN